MGVVGAGEEAVVSVELGGVVVDGVHDDKAGGGDRSGRYRSGQRILEVATDDEIWSYAGEQGHVIGSKDSDFRQLAFLHGPP